MDFNALSLECAPWVSPRTMAAIVKTESQFNPLAININAAAKLERQPKTKGEAVATAKWLLANGYNIDMGLGQVNSANLAKTKLSVDDAFDPCKNLAASATILKWNFESASKKIPGEQQALHAAISAYNTGSFTRGFSNGYVQKIVNSAGISSTKPVLINTTFFVAPIKLVGSAKNNLASAPKQPVPHINKVDQPNMEQKRIIDNATKEGLKDESVVYDASVIDSVMVYR